MIVFLNGSINSGKSTVAKILAERLGRTAVVEIDSLRAMVEWMPLAESIPLNLRNALSVIRNFASEGLSVVVPYPLSRQNHDYMMEGLKDVEVPKYVFSLSPSL
jgi:hypothetical protein